MNKDSKYAHILFNREHLFEVVRVGFMATKIGNLWCEGYVAVDRLPLIQVPYTIEQYS